MKRYLIAALASLTLTVNAGTPTGIAIGSAVSSKGGGAVGVQTQNDTIACRQRQGRVRKTSTYLVGCAWNGFMPDRDTAFPIEFARFSGYSRILKQWTAIVGEEVYIFMEVAK